MDSVKAISLDAFGTILELEPPVPALVGELRDGWGLEVSPEEARQALVAEITYYKAHQLEGHDEDSLVDLRLRCAGVLRENLPEAVHERMGAAELLPAMLRSLRFRPFPDVAEALELLRDQGLAVIVVSNWDVSLSRALEACGLLELIDHVISSAAVGAAKPSPVPFERGLELLDLDPSAAVHIGDEPDHDIAGALAAGLAPVLIHRALGAPPAVAPDIPIITTLAGWSPFLTLEA